MRRREFIRSLMGSLALGVTGTPAMASDRPLRGLYQSGGDFLAVGEFTEFGEGLFLFDYQGARLGRLVSEKEGEFRVSSTFLPDGKMIATLMPNGNGVRYRERQFRSVTLGQEAFRVRSGPVEIAGEISARADHPLRGVVVPIWGSGPGPHRGLDYWTFQFLACGWAVVTYDKRGSGASSGDWRTSGFDDLASDVRATLTVARERFGRIPVGLIGLSQGGWIAPMLAAQVDFLMLQGGAAVTPARQTLTFVESELRAYEFPESEIAAALAYYALDIDVSRRRRPWAEIERAYEEASARGAEWLLRPPLAADAPERTMWRLIADFDPAPLWRACQIPVLAIFGSKDLIVPPEPNARLLESFLPAATARRIDVLAGANHLGMVADKGVTAEYAKCTQVAPGYFPALSSWLAARA
ncbi:MAG: alpha/beta hydrolase [Alphaproteobacteria bacterium]